MILVSLVSACLFQVLSAQFICNETLPQGLTAAVNEAVTPLNLLAAPFKVGDYNVKLLTYYTESQAAAMELSYADDTIAFVFGYHPSYQPSDPGYVTRTMLPAIIKKLEGCVEATTLRYIGANDINSKTKLPYVHVQTAAHVSGLAYFYHPSIIENPPAEWTGKQIFGTSHHPVHGENIWFQGVVIFSGLQDLNYITNEADNHIGAEKDIIDTLNRVNEAFGKK